jgi:hypothetical protein
MPAGLIKDENGVRSGGDFGCDLVEMELHGFAVADRQHEGGAGATFGADRTEQIKSIGSVDRGQHGGANPSWPSNRYAKRLFTRNGHDWTGHMLFRFCGKLSPRRP